MSKVRKTPAHAAAAEQTGAEDDGTGHPGAEDVRSCLAALDAQIPGNERVFPWLAAGAARG